MLAKTTTLHEFIPPHLLPAIRRLLLAVQYAQALSCDVLQFAISFSELKALGLTLLDAQYLFGKGWLVCAQDISLLSDIDRRFRSLPRVLEGPDICIALTCGGAEIMRRQLDSAGDAADQLPPGEQRPASPSSTPKKAPHWDSLLQELRLGDHVVKHFRHPAPLQQLILATFEEDGWPPAIDDPLPSQRNQDPKRRLHYTVQNLNRAQHAPSIHFYINGNGQSIRWTVSSPRTT